MSSRLLPVGAQLLEAWRLMPLAQRMTLAMVAIGVVALLSALGGWAGSPSYDTLVAKLSDEDMTKVAEKLQTAGIDFKINGRSLAVPSSQVSDARVAIASAGISAGDGQPGFDRLFKGQNPLGLTDEMHRVNYQRAKEGELAATLRSINGIESARVHLVLPPPSFFSETKGEATASVTITPQGGRQLDGPRVQSIVSMVTSAVEGLNARNVSVIDTLGNTLHDGASGGAQTGVFAASGQQARQQEWEAGASAEIRQALERVFGPGSATVRVSAELNWDQKETNTERYANQETPAIGSEHKKAEWNPSSSGAPAGGTPGTASNVPTTPSYQSVVDGGAAGSAGFQKTEEIRNLLPDKIVERTVFAPGSVKRLSIVAVIDSAAVGDTDMAEVEKVLNGFADETRGDTVVLSKLPFNRSQLEADKVQLADQVLWSTVGEAATTASSALLPLGVLFLVFFVVLRGMPKGQSLQNDGGLATPVRVREVQAAQVVEAPRPSEDPRAKAIHQQMVTLARDEPATVSGLVSTLLEDQRR